MTKYYVTPPTEEYGPAGGGRLFIRYRLTRGQSLMSHGGVWSVTTFPTEDVMKEADIFFVAGCELRHDVEFLIDIKELVAQRHKYQTTNKRACQSWVKQVGVFCKTNSQSLRARDKR